MLLVTTELFTMKNHYYSELLDKKTGLIAYLEELDSTHLAYELRREIEYKNGHSCDQAIAALSKSLHHLCETGDLEGVMALLEEQTSDEARLALVNNNDEGFLPLHLACQAGHLEIAQLLITSGADYDLLDGKEGQSNRKTAIAYALESGIADELIPAKKLWSELLALTGGEPPLTPPAQQAEFFSKDHFTPELEKTLRFYYDETQRLLSDKKYSQGKHQPFHQRKVDGMLAALREAVTDVARVLLNPVAFSIESLQTLCHDIKVTFAEPACLARNRCCFWQWKTSSSLKQARRVFEDLPEQYRPS